MQAFSPSRIRNVALVGHGASGKTTLAEALLHHAGALTRVGRVEDGSTALDTEPEEQARGLSISLALGSFEYQHAGETYKINLLDTPGYPDFVADVAAALGVADLAVFVVSAVEGVQVQTEYLWRMAAEGGLPRMIFVNKLDRERSSFDRTLAELQETFGQGIAPLELPIGAEAEFAGIADLLTDTAWYYDAGVARSGRDPRRARVPRARGPRGPRRGDRRGRRRHAGALPRGGHALDAELESVLASGVAGAGVFPVVCGSATAEIGIDRLAQFICEIGPSPLQRPPVSVGGRRRHRRDRPRSRRRAARLRLQDHRRSLRRPDLPVQGPLRHRDPRRPAPEPPVGAPGAAARRCSRCGGASSSTSPTSPPATSGRWPS